MHSRLDAHQHFWNYAPEEYGWITENMRALRRDFLPHHLRAACSECGVEGSIAVQARQTLAETSRLLELAEQNDFVRAVVGWAPLADDNAGSVLEKLAAHPKLRGVRHVLQDEADDFYMLRGDFNRGVDALKPLGLAYDILIYERHLPQTLEFVDRHPGQVFILDHLAKPRVRARRLSPWRENLGELAKRPGVYCKISGLVTEADHQLWTREELLPYLDNALDAFGPQRLMFGSDWPVCLLAASYANWVSIVEDILSRLSPAEQRSIWCETAEKAYALS